MTSQLSAAQFTLVACLGGISLPRLHAHVCYTHVITLVVQEERATIHIPRTRRKMKRRLTQLRRDGRWSGERPVSLSQASLDSAKLFAVNVLERGLPRRHSLAYRFRKIALMDLTPRF